MTNSPRNALVLTAAPGAPMREAAAASADLLRGREALEARWLDQDGAWELAFTPNPDDDLAALLAEARTQLAYAAIDVNIVFDDPAVRRKRLFVADMDSTMIGQECIDELADFAGFKAHVAAITERAMRGEIAFEPALRERVALLKGLPASVIDEVLRERITLMPGGKTLVATMRANGAKTCLVSGGFTGFVDRVAATIGFDDSRANVLEIEQDRLAGRVREPILGREAKLAALLELRDRFDLAPEQTLAVGDGANDLAMLAEAGLGVAYHAKPAVAAAAAARIDHCDLTALLYLQGYRSDEFAAA
jgi:phosphoserine phosphatase